MRHNPWTEIASLSATVSAVVLRVPMKVDAFNAHVLKSRDLLLIALIKVLPYVRYVLYFFPEGKVRWHIGVKSV